MASMAIEPAGTIRTGRKSKKPRGRTVRRAVRTRRDGQRWYSFMQGRSRVAQLADAMVEIFDDRSEAPEDYWRSDGPVVDWRTFDLHLQARAYEDERRLEELEEAADHTPERACHLRLQGLRATAAAVAAPVVDVSRKLREFDLELGASGHVELPPDAAVLEEIRQDFDGLIAA